MSKTTKPSWQDNDALLIYRVGPVLCCGPTLPVITITLPPPLTHLPGTNIAEPGIFKHGSYIVSAIDLRYRFGVKQENWKQPGQVIIAQHGEMTRGYYVDEIKDVIHFPETGWGQLPSHLPKGIFSRTLLLNKQIYLYTEFETLSQLQGSGYLAEYISQLEEIKHNKTTKNNLKVSPKTTPTITQEHKTISTDNVNKTHTDLSSDNTPAENSIAPIHNIDSPVTRNSLKSSPGNISKVASANNKMEKPDIPSIKDKTNKNANAFAHNAKNKITTINMKHQVSAQETPKAPTSKNNTTFSSQLSEQKQDKDIKNKASSTRKTDSMMKPDSSIKTSSLDKKNKVITGTPVTPISPITRIPIEKTKQTSESSLATQTLSNAPSINKNTPSKTETHYFGMFILFMIVIIASGGSYYYISKPIAINNTPSRSINFSDISTNDKTNSPSLNDFSLALTDEKESRIIDTNSESPKTTSSIERSLSRNYDKTDFSKTDINKNDSTLHIKNENPTEYHANIKQENNTITIELDGPLPPAINTSSETSPEVDSITIMANSDISNPSESKASVDTLPETIFSESLPSQSDSSQPEPLKNTLDKSTQTTITEIVHIIIQGDTLWAIAKRYLLNPYRYPELAKLSKIKNPDLIYPGNRVRIIYKETKNSQKKSL